MERLSKQTATFASLFLLGWLALNEPFLALFISGEPLFGLPRLYSYLFLVWLLLIIATLLLSRTSE